jgi:CO/xanthine dehydrogenase Mo-binding subunit
MIVAEELCADWSTVRVEQAPASNAYGDQTTGGSTSIQTYYGPLRGAGAVGRELMIEAAAQTWGVAKDTCYAQHNLVFHQPSQKQLTYAELVRQAGALPVPKAGASPLKDPKDFTLIGTSVGRVDNPDIVTGKAVYGLDVRLPGMLFATVARCPVFGGTLVKFDDAKARAVPGVRAVVPIDCGVAVVAENTWAAIQGRAALLATWDEGANAKLNSAEIEKQLLDKATALKTAEGEMAAVYTFPYFGHVNMEPMNCTADVHSDRCEVWVPTQNPQAAFSTVTRLLPEVPSKAIRVNVTLVGTGLGRRLEMTAGGSMPPQANYVSQAVQVSKAVGAPVQVMWTREDDLHHDLYHPLSVYRVTARLDDIGSLSAERYEAYAEVPAGYWRSVTNPPEAFARASFMGEYAAATKVDPLALYKTYLASNPRAMAVVDLAASKAGWGTPLPDRTGRGLAYHATWDVTHVAEVAEVAVAKDGTVRVNRVVCAVDCGLAVNPNMVIAQMESAIVFGLTAVLKEAITIEGGRVTQNNYSDYPILRFDEMPAIEVYIVPSTQSPTGVGEMGNPPLAPAVANAIFAAIGKRVRRLPIHAEDLR